mmetsp:Transcript_116387/g.329845  ORF Transcript_116387/g.329845 Transcript_116387/m.329845 type:complete len:207 (-) Transcript_116387:51-671(-)
MGQRLLASAQLARGLPPRGGAGHPRPGSAQGALGAGVRALPVAPLRDLQRRLPGRVLLHRVCALLNQCGDEFRVPDFGRRVDRVLRLQHRLLRGVRADVAVLLEERSDEGLALPLPRQALGLLLLLFDCELLLLLALALPLLLPLVVRGALALGRLPCAGRALFRLLTYGGRRVVDFHQVHSRLLRDAVAAAIEHGVRATGTVRGG